MIVPQPLTAAERLFCRRPRDFRMVILFRQMGQNYVFRSPIIIAGEEFGERVIRQMPHPAHHPLLHRPRIRPRTQHLHIVIRFHHQHAAAPQMVAHARRHVAEIGGKTNFDAFRAKGEAHRIGGVVRNRKGHDLDVAHAKAPAGREMFGFRQLRNRALLVAHRPAPGLMGRRGQEDRHVQFCGQPLQAGNMVGVFVRDQDRGNFLGALAQRPQPLASFAARQPGIHQNARCTRRHQRAVPTAAARQHRNRHSHAVAYPQRLWKREQFFRDRYLWWDCLAVCVETGLAPSPTASDRSFGQRLGEPRLYENAGAHFPANRLSTTPRPIAPPNAPAIPGRNARNDS